MANNNIKLSIGVEQKGLLSAIKSTETLERNIKKLSGSYASGSVSYSRYNTAIGNLAKATGRSKSELLAYGKTLRANEKALKDSRDATEKANLEVKAYALARRQATEEDKRRTAEQKKETLATERQVQALHRLNLKYKEGYAAADIMAREVKDLERALEAGIIDIHKMTAAKAQLNAQMKAGTGYFANAATGLQVVGKRANRVGVLAQQAGYQFGDFAVQVQSGTSPLIAFSQQATQLIGTFSMLATSTRAITAFAALGVVVPVVSALAGAFLRTRKEAKKSEDSLDLLTSALKSSTAAAKEAMSPIEDLTERYGKFAQAVRESSRLAAQAQVTKAMVSLRAATEQTRKGLNGFRSDFLRYGKELRLHTELSKSLGERTRLNASAFADLDRGVTEAKNAVDASAKAMGLNTLQANNLYESLSLLESAEGPASIAQAAEDALDAIERMFPPTEQIPTNIADMVEQLSLVLKSASEAAKAMEDMSKIDMTSNISSAATAAGKLADNLRIARGYRLDELAGGNADFFDPRNDSGRSGIVTRERDNPQGSVTSPSPSGGGATQQDLLAKLRERIKLDTELLGKTKERQAVERAIANSSTEYSQKAIDKAVAELEAYNQIVEKRQELQGIHDTAKSSMEDGFMAMVEGTKSVEDAFKDMARSIIKELYDVYVIKQIVGSVGGGTGIKGILGGIFGKASGGTVQANQPYLVGEKGPELIVPRNRGHVMNADLTSNAMGGGGDVYVTNNFTMAANGDDSVKKIIAQSMPAIVNASKQGVMDARRRGGAMKNTFG